MKSLFVLSLLVLGSFVSLISGDRILVLSPIGSKSHKNVFDPLVEGLASKGHQLFTIMPYKSSKLPSNVKEIVPAASMNMMDAIPDPFVLRRKGVLGGMMFNTSSMHSICHEVHQNEEFKEMTRNLHYDVIITNGFFNCYDCLIHTLKAPHIVVTTMAAPPAVAQYTGNYLPQSFVPHIFLGYSDRMNFGQRLVNTAFDIIASLYLIPRWMGGWEDIYKKYVGQDCPSIEEINANVSLILMNSYFSLTHPRPNLPDNVEVGGMHCRPAKPLPKVTNQLLD